MVFCYKKDFDKALLWIFLRGTPAAGDGQRDPNGAEEHISIDVIVPEGNHAPK
jgi:hypothetical protein